MRGSQPKSYEEPSSTHQSTPGPTLSPIKLLLRLKISEHSPIANIIKQAPSEASSSYGVATILPELLALQSLAKDSLAELLARLHLRRPMLPDFERNDSEQQDDNIALVQQREDEDIDMIIDTAVQPTPEVISARPISSSSSSNIMDPVTCPSTSRLPASILPRTLSTPNVDESSEQWVLGRTHYHDTQVIVNRSLSCIIEDDAPRFVSDIQHL